MEKDKDDGSDLAADRRPFKRSRGDDKDIVADSKMKMIIDATPTEEVVVVKQSLPPPLPLSRKFTVNATTAVKNNVVGRYEIVKFVKDSLKKQSVEVETVHGTKSFNIIITAQTKQFTKSSLRSLLQSFIKLKHRTNDISIKSTGGSSYQLWINKNQNSSSSDSVEYMLNFSHVASHDIVSHLDAICGFIAKPFDGSITTSIDGLSINIKCDKSIKKCTIKNVLHHYLQKKKYLGALKITASNNGGLKNMYELHLRDIQNV